jgi:hypothetical protein|tara:strand:- start:57 stop:446 length:390 start_codon:yes stop_codon:yes gene_type:complete
MKKSLLLAAALACSGVVAQEKQIWACQQVAGTQLIWEDGAWRQVGVEPTSILLRLGGKYSSYRMSEEERLLDCSEALSGKVSCLDSLSSKLIYIDPTSGKMGRSTLFGAAEAGDSRSALATEVYNCAKL